MPVWLGLDFGLRRIGIAASNEEGTLAFAVATHVEGRDGSFLDYLATIIEERQAQGIVVGLPLTADGREAAMAARTRRFADRLTREFELPLVLFDERYTSQQAQRSLKGVKRRSKEAVDALAAEIILQDFLDARRGPGERADENETEDS